MTGTSGAGQVLREGLTAYLALPRRAQMLVLLRLMERLALALPESCAGMSRDHQDQWFQSREERLAAMGPVPDPTINFEWPKCVDPLVDWLRDSGRTWDEAVRCADSEFEAGQVLQCYQSIVGSLVTDPRINALQVMILAAGDIDLLGFFCANESFSPDGPLPRSVSGNLPQVFPLTLVTPEPGPEDYR